MKNKLKILCVLIIAILIIVMIIVNNTNADVVELTPGNSQIVSGENLIITISIADNVSGIEATLDYDYDIFTYNGGYQELGGIIINESTDGVVSITGGSSEISTNAIQLEFSTEEIDTEEEFEFKLSFIQLVIEGQDQTEKESISTYVTVKPSAGSEVPSLSETNITLKVNETKQIQVTNGVSVTWTSNEPSIATVDPSGTIVGISPGNATITAEAGNGNQATVNVVVTPETEPPTGEVPILSETNITLKVNETKQIQVTNGVSVTWTSNEPSIATVDPSGTIVGISAGNATITAEAGNGNQATVSVVVEDGGSENPGNTVNPGNTAEPENTANPVNNGQNIIGTGNSTYSNSSNGVKTIGGNSSSEANEAVPATGENTVETIGILIIVTLIIASIIFRRKIKLK